MTCLARNMRFLRKQHGSDTAACAAMFNKEASWWKACEYEKQHPNPEELLRIADKFGVSVDRLLRVELKHADPQRSKQAIKLLVLDVDGVLTDGGMYYSEKGDELKKFNVKDGRALIELKKAGIKVGFLSSGFNENIIRNRAGLFDVSLVRTGTEDKLSTLKRWMKELRLGPEAVACVGDDINDIPVMQHAGLAACPSDALEQVKAVAHVVLQQPGGRGCVREFVERFLLTTP